MQNVTFPFFRRFLYFKYISSIKKGDNIVDKNKENGILLVQSKVVTCCKEVDNIKNRDRVIQQYIQRNSLVSLYYYHE